ncbi:MAM and LDL-receptor class A domain-containing protein 1 [Chionoecetes opilio]|uniref:MAM and LDL-receptor class A domain-containing protein 1 n=1 Tax=Chionoecetes opilio TaxID=41210 RepID=A0A8J8WN30_CHIOP|nr:MAM and LDL-receptor class A domain-containing protein 1 [Chionoecetes opilio]
MVAGGGWSVASVVVVVVAVVVVVVAAVPEDHPLLRNKRALRLNVPCVSNGEFYRNPNANPEKLWSLGQCSKYYLCLDDEVYEFKCSVGLLFDISRQICDFKAKVFSCDTHIQLTTPKPLLDGHEHNCQLGEYACGDRTCLPSELFCDGEVDCEDQSDEGWCDADHDPNAALRCDYTNCTLPDCFCSRDGTLTPANMEPSQVPQMITLTFDDAVNYENWNLYNQLFTETRTNPNGCPIHGTFYISHEYNNYQYAQQLWNDGHEIAVHSITHKGPEYFWTNNATIEDWFDEFVGQANILNRFGGVRMEDLWGVRVPYLRVGWNRQFIMMREFGFVYDSSMAAPFSNPPLWPYTLDYKMPHKCMGTAQKCPSRSFPGIWEIVLNQLQAGEYYCAMMDQCPPTLDEEDVYQMLMHNFQRHYDTNRAPLGLYFHTIWFKTKHNMKGIKRFLDEVRKLPDVWIVNNQEVIKWMREPTPNSQLAGFEPWKCQQKIAPEDKACSIPQTCKLKNRMIRGDRYLHTCFECPDVYPWLKNEFGLRL